MVQPMDTDTEESIAQAINDCSDYGSDASAYFGNEFAGTCHCDSYVVQYEPTHHLTDISFVAPTAMQSNLPTFTYDENFPSFRNEIYEEGDSRITYNPITENYKSLRLRAISIMNVNSVQGTPNHAPLRVLFDTGADVSMFNFRALPTGAHPKTGLGTRVTGIHGAKVMNQEVLLSGITFPKFSGTQKVPGPIQFTMFQNPESSCDVILGMDTLQVLGFDIICATTTITWNKNMIPFRPIDYFNETVFSNAYYEDVDDPFEEESAVEAGYKSNVILHSKYDAVDTTTVAKQQKHLSQSQKEDLTKLLSTYSKPFSGKLGKYPSTTVHLDLQPGATPYHCRPYPVSKHHEKVFKDELQRLWDAGVLTRCGASEW
jgi:hypothetical protein